MKRTGMAFLILMVVLISASCITARPESFQDTQEKPAETPLPEPEQISPEPIQEAVTEPESVETAEAEPEPEPEPLPVVEEAPVTEAPEENVEPSEWIETEPIEPVPTVEAVPAEPEEPVEPEPKPEPAEEPIPEPVIEEVPEPEEEVEPVFIPSNLLEAIEADDLEAAEDFILEDTRVVQHPDEKGRTPLHHAVILRSRPMIDLLLKHGADLGSEDSLGRLPIHIAAESSYTLARELAGDGSLIFAEDNGGESVLEAAFADGSEALSDLLGERLVNVRDDGGNTPMHFAAQLGDVEAAQMLVNLGADMNIPNAENLLPIDIAFSRTGSIDHAELAALLISHYSLMPQKLEFFYAFQALSGKDVHMRFEGGRTALHYAAQYGHPALMETFIKMGANLESRDEQQNTPLHIAVIQKRLELVNMLVRYGADINARDAQNNTPVHLAVSENQDIDIITYLISVGAQVNARNIDGDTPLSLAVSDGIEADYTRMLIAAGADPNNRNTAGDTPLHSALSLDRETVGTMLIDAGADIYAQNYNGITPLIRALVRGVDTVSWFYRTSMNQFSDNEGNAPLHTAVRVGAEPEVLSHILSTGCDPDLFNLQGQTPLHLAVSLAYLEAAQILIDHGADMFGYDNRGKSPLLLAFEQGTEFFRQMISEEHLSLGDHAGNTPLHLAAERDFHEITSYLVSAGAEVQARNDQGQTPLHLAAQSDQVKSCQLLAANGAVINTRDNYGNTPLHTSISSGSSKTGKYLLLLGARVDLRNLSGNTPMHQAVLHRDMSAIKMLREFGASLEIRDNTGMTPLLLAARRNYHEVARLLIEYGADYNTRDDRGNTPLHEAVRNRNKEISNLLAERGASIYASNRYGDTPLLVALRSGSEVIDWFITDSLVYARDDRGNTPLHSAIQLHAGTDIISLLIKKGSDINSRNNIIQTPLHAAFEANNKSAVEILAAAGADIFAKNADGISPLTLAMNRGIDAIDWLIHEENIKQTDQVGNTVAHIAAASGSVEMMEHMLRLGADITAVNLAGALPLDTALEAGNTEVAAYLRQQGR